MRADRGHAVRLRRFFAAVSVVGLVGCLPAGAPPAGRHVVKDRSLSGVFLSPSEQEGVPSHLLATGPLSDPGLPSPLDGERVADLYRFDGGEGSVLLDGLGASSPVARDMQIPGQDPTDTTLASDNRGQLLLVRWNRAIELPAMPFELWRTNVAGGTAESLTEVAPTFDVLANPDPRVGPRPFILSPARTQVFAADSGFGWVFGPTTRQFLWQANTPAFIGEDFYCAGLVSLDGVSTAALGTNVVRIKPDAPPEILLSSSGHLGVFPVVGDRTPQLVLVVYGDQGGGAFALLDTETQASRSLPPEKGQATFLSASSDGHYLAFLTAQQTQDPSAVPRYGLFLYDWTANQYAIVDSVAVAASTSAVIEWRPGTHELWFTTASDEFSIWRPFQAEQRLSGTLARRTDSFGRKSSSFSRDGRYWFSQGGGDRPTLYLGVADDPSAAPFALNPPGTQASRHLEIGDGRLLVEAWANDYHRNDIYLVDPAARSARALGSAGRVVVAGATRALAILNWQLSRSSGELTLLDYATGARTVLAEDVYAVDVDRGTSAVVPPGTDVLAPGTRFAFLLRNRLESRDDGLWVADLP